MTAVSGTVNPSVGTGVKVSDLERLGSALRILRKQSGLQQKDISARTGVSRSQISRYERGRDIPGVTTLVKYLDAVGADFQALHDAL